MASEDKYVPFSQREGLSPAPPQLKLGEVSNELRRLFDYSISQEISRNTQFGSMSSYFSNEWARLAADLHVFFFKLMYITFDPSPYKNREIIVECVYRYKINELFDLIEFMIRHKYISNEFKSDIRDAFILSRSAYRVHDDQIVAIGTDEQAAAFERAIGDATEKGADAARQHLIQAGAALGKSDWAGCVRESIHAVEALAKRLAPGADTLGPALSVLEKKGHLHGSLKSAFTKLYGYSSDQEGIRHALVFEKNPHVDEADALFMLGACASFVSYLIVRSGSDLLD